MDYREEGIRQFLTLVERGETDETELHNAINLFRGEKYVTILTEQLGLMQPVLTGLDGLFARAPYPRCRESVVDAIARIHFCTQDYRAAYAKSFQMAFNALDTEKDGRYFRSLCALYRVNPQSLAEFHRPMMDAIHTAFTMHGKDLALLRDGVQSLAVAVTGKDVLEHHGIEALSLALCYTPRDADLTTKCTAVVGQLCDVDAYGAEAVAAQRETMKAVGIVNQLTELMEVDAEFLRNAVLRALTRFIGQDAGAAAFIRQRLDNPAAANLLSAAAANEMDNSDAMRDFLKALYQ